MGNAMKLPRRKFLLVAAGAAALPATLRVAWAQAYPIRPVHLIVGFPPGGPSDIIARLIGQWLSERLGQQFVIENRPGASTNIATEAVVRAPADGHTLLLVLPSAAINATLYDNLHFNFIRDITLVANVIRAPFVLVVNPSVPAQHGSRIYCLRQSQSGQAQHGLDRHWTPDHMYSANCSR